ncbi:hypothetical protein [Streptomyces albidoflavus]
MAPLFGVTRLYMARMLSEQRLEPMPPARAVSGSAYYLLGDVVKSHIPGHPLDPQALREFQKEQGPGRMVATGEEELPVIVGYAELAEIFHSTPQTVQSYARQGRWRPADWRVSGSYLWLMEPLVAPGVDPRGDDVPARSREWKPDQAVVAALREGTYDGPGSVVKRRGRAAKVQKPK